MRLIGKSHRPLKLSSRKAQSAAAAAGMQLCLHAIGDQAVSLVLDFCQEITQAHGECDRRFRIEHAQHAEKITGSYTGRYGTFALEGTIKGRTIIFSFPMAAEGESIPMTFTGEVAADAQTMTGKAAFGDMGEAPWTAKRDKTPE